MSGLPPLATQRKVTIYSPARTAAQQGVSQTAAGAHARRLRPPALLAAAAACRCLPPAAFSHPAACTRLHPPGGGPAWKIAHENQGKWVNPLIGWTSTADPLENVGNQLYFSSKEDAIKFAGGCGGRAGCGAPRQVAAADPAAG